MRVAKGRYGDARKGELSKDGHAVLWGRPKERRPVTSGLLAIIADYVPSATGHALGRLAGANSLDNTIRIRELRETEWMCSTSASTASTQASCTAACTSSPRTAR